MQGRDVSPTSADQTKTKGDVMAYFPNGCAGEVLDVQCADCPLGEGPCPVALVQMMFNYDQCSDDQAKLRQAMSCLVDDEGMCQVRKQILDNVTRVSSS